MAFMLLLWEFKLLIHWSGFGPEPTTGGLSASRHRHGNRQEAGQEEENVVVVVVAAADSDGRRKKLLFFKRRLIRQQTWKLHNLICATKQLNAPTHTHTHTLQGHLVASC